MILNHARLPISTLPHNCGAGHSPTRLRERTVNPVVLESYHGIDRHEHAARFTWPRKSEGWETASLAALKLPDPSTDGDQQGQKRHYQGDDGDQEVT